MDTLTTTAAEIDFTTPMPSTTNEGVHSLPSPLVETPPAIQDGGMASLIERMARDPAVNIDKLERLIAMKKDMDAQQAQVAFDNAMSDAQESMKAIRTNAENKQTSSRYATYAALDHDVRPIYSRHGFALSFNTGDAPQPEMLRVLCTVSHRSGHRQDYKIDMPADGKGARGNDVMTRTHATGAAAQYGQRYLLKFIFNLAVGDIDDDGNGAGADIERMAGPNALRDGNGKLLSNYDVEKVNKARDWADSAVQRLNLMSGSAAQQEARAWRDEAKSIPTGKRKAPLDWLRDNSPGQYLRVRQVYQNVTGEDLE